MERALLPIDVCERIIDSFNSCPRFFPPHGYFVDLCACALTCRDWVSRSRCNLYSSIKLRNARQLDALLNTIASLPFLADLVQELVVHPSDKYLPFAQEDLASALRRVRRAHICYYDWAAHHPRYHQLVARYPIVELSLLGGTYRTMADRFRVVWAFEHLQTLTLAIIEPFQQPGIPVDEIIKRRKRICLKLKTVTILGPALLGTKALPPLGCFGNALTTLCLIWTREFGKTPVECANGALSRYSDHISSDTGRNFMILGLPDSSV
ncbi:uncharacterized protein TRAVEDRAFT_49159 [Trametes versicolor FP-101664 SS1]|uniref:uncharacterized protein n=1 Tax=Trametes versicolor (strain FP-101664) TaxID=717944 RepID=UPI0004623035|nr:uncharacterized protein TRAVEDRAFT_49159 [Trametes versicolor FP-101664 SS1]EIW56331.1 hypothetical protein TRAVEDRAFT_49159 [Trametes versicolor FP-101664 SS1]